MRHDGRVRYPLLLILSGLVWVVLTAPVLLSLGAESGSTQMESSAGLFTTALVLLAMCVLWPRRQHAVGGSTVRIVMFVTMAASLGMMLLLPEEHGLAWWPMGAAVGVLLSFVLQLFSVEESREKVAVLAECIGASLVVALGSGWFVWVREIRLDGASVSTALWVSVALAVVGVGLGVWLITLSRPKALGQIPMWTFAIAGSCGVVAMGMPTALVTRYFIY